MCSVIVLSSSPPQLFARSPTPASSPGSILRGDVEGRHRFKPVVANRDGFSSSLKSAVDVLRSNRRAQNLLFRDPRGTQGSETYKNGLSELDEPQPQYAVKTTSPSPSERPVEGHEALRKVLATQTVEIQPSKDASLASAQPTTTAPQEDTPSLPITSFAYEGSTSLPVPSSKSDGKHVTKRRKIDLIDLGSQNGVHNESPLTSVANTTSKPKKTAAPKKYTTITSLSTALYGHKASEITSPIATYLKSTKTQVEEVTDPPDPSIPKPKAKKARRVSKKLKPKPIVLSPGSALKVYDVQDVVFGSASQLTEQHHFKPSTTITHSKKRHMERFDISSDPVSTQLTQPISIQSETPRTIRGTNKFARTKNLWGAAGRYDDNALFHVESVDLFDSPSIKDALNTHSRPWNFNTTSLAAQGEARQKRSDPAVTNIYDIDDVTTPAWNAVKLNHSVTSFSQRRNLHTSPTRGSPRKVSRASLEVSKTQSPKTKEKVSKATMPKPSKPSYAVLTTPELTRQLTAFGFKKIKKRETMIEVLEKCWESKHGPPPTTDPVPQPIDDPVTPVKQSDFLSKVHGISARPEPKVKKIPKPRKPREPKGSPKVKKSTEPKEKKPRAPRKSRAKPVVVESSDLELKHNEDANPDKSPDTDHIPTLPVKSAAKPRAKRQTKSRPAKEPSGLEAVEDTAATTVEDKSITRSDQILQEAPNLPDIQKQITRAITTFQAAPYRNHQVDPTWHEKILMYDPIVLEDLTMWLNTEGFGKINEDREVGALEVRDWCESRGVCCLWRGGWRGNKASKSGADEN